MNTSYSSPGGGLKAPYYAPTLESIEISVEKGFAESEESLWAGNGTIDENDTNDAGSY